jgi:hypothetical protein
MNKPAGIPNVDTVFPGDDKAIIILPEEGNSDEGGGEEIERHKDHDRPKAKRNPVGRKRRDKEERRRAVDFEDIGH